MSNIIIRSIEEADTDNILKWRNNPYVLTQFIDKRKLTAEVHLNWYTNFIKPGLVAQFIIVDTLNNCDIGTTFIKNVTKKDEAEFGYFIGDDNARGHGYGSIAGRLTVQYGFEVLKLDKIIARAYTENEASVKALQKIGFKSESTYFDSDVNKEVILFNYINMEEE